MNYHICIMGGDWAKCACGIKLAFIGSGSCLPRIEYLYSFLQYQLLSN